MNKKIIITVLIISNSLLTFAQENKKEKKSFFNKEKLSLTASVGHTKDIPLFSFIGVPNVFNNPIRPWYAIGIEKSYKALASNRKYYGLELNYHDYKYVDKSIGLTLIGGFDKKIYKGLYGGLGLGIGLQKAKRADIVYTYENNMWVGNTYPGKWQYNRTNFRVSAELGYRFKKQNINAFVGANAMFLLNVYGKDVPIGLYQTPFKIGIRKKL